MYGRKRLYGKIVMQLNNDYCIFANGYFQKLGL